MAKCCSISKRKTETNFVNQAKTKDERIPFHSPRLSGEEKEYYSKLFLQNAEEDYVTKEKFPELLGLIGTDISLTFAARIFEVFSADGKKMRLEDYMKYIDLYHHGNERERCMTTFRIMDQDKNNKVDFAEFESYINLIVTAIKKVHAGSEDDTLTSQEIKLLFNKISNNKPCFTYSEFEKVYFKKPALLSWIDYFKNNDNQYLMSINKSIKLLLILFERFNRNMHCIFARNTNFELRVGDFQNELDKFNFALERVRKKVMRNNSSFNVRNIFSNGKFNMKDNTDMFTGKEFYKENLSKLKSNINKEENNYDIESEMISSDDSLEEQIEELENVNKLNADVNSESHLDKEKKLSLVRNEIMMAKIHTEVVTTNNLLQSTLETNPNQPTFLNKENILINGNIANFSKDKYIKQMYAQFTNFQLEDCSGGNILHTNPNNVNAFDSLNNLHPPSDEISKKLSPCLLRMFEINTSIIKWVSTLFDIVQKKLIKPIKKELVKVTKVNKPISEIINYSELSKSKENFLKLTDENFAILLNMIMGIQLVVNSTSNITLTLHSDLCPYLVHSKYSLPSANFNSAHLEGIFYISTFGSVIFQNIRQNEAIDKSTFIQSLSPSDFVTEILISSTTIIEELFSTSKSGSLFYHSRDGNYILKTISKNEYKSLQTILADYYKHLVCHPSTLLPKYLGCYKLVRKLRKNKIRFYFLVMDNLFSTEQLIGIKYDIKGSTVGREVENTLPLEERGKENYSFALKDLDLEHRGKRFAIGKKREALLQSAKSDCEFLKRHGIIDYSLLVGIHKLDQTKKIIEEYKNKKEEINLDLKKKVSWKSDDRLNVNKMLEDNTEEFVKNEKEAEIIKQNKINANANANEKDLINYTISDSDLVSNLSNAEEHTQTQNKNQKLIKNNNLNESVILTQNNNKNSLNQLAFKFPFRDTPDGGSLSSDETEIYYIGLIDILIKFNCKKKCEYLFKSLYHCNNQFSVVPPNKYRKRFLDYISKIFTE